MFSDVQKLKLAEIQNNLDCLKAEEQAMHDEVCSLRDKLWALEHQQERGLSGKKQFSVLERLLTKRKAYKRYQNAVAELKALPDKITALMSEIEIAEMQTADKIATSGILQKIEEAEKNIWAIEDAVSLAELNITPADAMSLLETNVITPVLDESDRKIFERPREYETKGKAALCAVHKMDIMPENSRLSTLKEADVERTEKIMIDGKEYTYSYLMERDTIHLSMNDEVSSHMYGNWDQCHYTVLQPCAEIANEKIGALEPNDTFTRGGVDLTPNAWILCPANEVETVKELNPHVHVLGYKGENAMGLAAPFLSQLGYRAENVNAGGWGDHESEQQFYRIAEREKLPVIQHTNSVDYEDEVFKIGTNKTIALIKMLVDHNLVQSVADLERLRQQLDNACFDVSEYQMATGITTNRNNVEVLAEKMQRAGMPLSMAEQVALQAQMDHPIEECKAMRNNLPLCDYLTHVMVDCAVRAHAIQAEQSL